jgi:hypothetical protein
MRFTARNGRLVVICDSEASFELIRAEYFPHVERAEWRVDAHYAASCKRKAARRG